jgi:hypothetical protein
MATKKNHAGDASWKGLLWAGGSMAGTGIFLVGLFILLDVLITVPVWHDWRLDARGVSTQASPLSMRVAGSGSHDAGTVVSHYIRVRFHDEKGAEHQAELMSADSTVLARASRKQPIAIEYDPQDPELVRVKGASASLFGNFSFIPLVEAIIGIILFVFGVRVRRRGLRG